MTSWGCLANKKRIEIFIVDLTKLTEILGNVRTKDVFLVPAITRMEQVG